MSKEKIWLIGILSLLILASLACGLPSATTPPTQVPGAIDTQAAGTIYAQLTQTGLPVTATVAGLLPTLAPSATSTLPLPTPTALPPTPTPIPSTPTPIPPTPTATPIPCNWAQFVKDVTIRDGTAFSPGSVFTKTWRLKNIGSCTWKRDYRLAFSSGERMDGARSAAIDEVVNPGETLDVSVELVAPEDEGRYRGYWQLSNSSGDPFGLGPDANNPFWVEIVVIEANKYAYDFGLSYCAAEWRSDEGRLPCPGETDDRDGFVVLLDRPLIEIDRVENEKALWTNPNNDDNGWIRGEYPEFEVKADHRFKAIVGCLDGASKCDVIFQLRYRIGDGDLKTLWETREVYDDAFTRVDVGLSSLAGEDVQFVLSVLTNGSPRDDLAFWLVPRIVDVDD